ncbi:phospholipase A2 inhibitor gamma subunit B-like isoform X2 [Vidua chalybeata]|uniref:phospholipase A2 inhibitor gamma subunit B-like isoform X2 n=1 Tax=Vidua chalybeata TaxID=81927 RepID=UPI0023A7C96D|nr:phospholipase A2 inhibitor gamma subunit B-like isoform X2 [Vidua chalybeata]
MRGRKQFIKPLWYTVLCWARLGSSLGLRPISMRVSLGLSFLLAFLDPGGMAISSSIKSCLPSHVCHLGPVTVNYGKVKAKSHLVCCTGDDCRTTSVSLPPDNDVPNGYQCPACYSVDSFQCGNEVVNCTGSEDQCVDLAGLMNAGGLSLKAAMKGCTTISECSMVGDGKNSLGIMDIKLKRFQCRPASAMYSVVYSAGVAAPHKTFLPVLSGFILEKVLF